MDTVYALSTAQGKAGVAVIRISGPDALTAVELLCGDVPAFRMATLRVLRDSEGVRLDEALVLTFPRDGSFTGEEVVELQTHGSVAVVSSLLGELSKMDGLRPAEPGEFTRRALQNGRMDLSQVEGLPTSSTPRLRPSGGRRCVFCPVILGSGRKSGGRN